MGFGRCEWGRALAALVLVAGSAGCAGGRAEERSVPGVTSRPCPHPVNEGNGCIYLGTISDLSAGPFRALGVPVTRAQRAFWDRVNRRGGIGGHDVDVVTYVRDSRYDPRRHVRAYDEIKGRVLALAQTLGSPTTDAILDALRADEVVAVPASFPSRWEFEDVILESGASYCFEGMNAVDYAAREFRARTVMAVYFPGDYGDDAVGGVRRAAAARGLSFSEVRTGRAARSIDAAVAAIVRRKPDLVFLSVGPAETGAVAAKAVARGFRGRFMGDSPTWNKGLLASKARRAIQGRYLTVAPLKRFATDSPGHAAMRRALGRVEPDEGYTAGWALSYPLKAVLERAAAQGRLTRAGLYDAVRRTEMVDYEGMLPVRAGRFSGGPDAQAFRESVIERPDAAQYSGLKVLTDFFAGGTARAHRLDTPCDRRA
ncbi:ABC transporter substrate-binding protein [Actinomadura yumaensis]|uniref:ABC transporter substrate-binding protein n=2 Tax=Actinomadura yumaensis TaxID=111807 RepID=A0ABW2CZH9_9ACTN